MRTKFLLICILSFSYIGCKSDIEPQVKPTSLNQKPTKEITKKDIANLNYNDFLLSSDATKAVNDWQKYKDLNTQIDYLKSADLSFFKSEMTILEAFLKDFKIEIPKALSTNEINSRITALETKVLKLNSLLQLDNIIKAEQLEAIKEVFTAFSNLNLQINKKLEFEANNILKPE